MSFYIIPTINIRKENISFALIYQYPGCFMALGKKKKKLLLYYIFRQFQYKCVDIKCIN